METLWSETMMSDAVPTPSGENSESPKWQPLEAIDRRVLGVLIEKAKTTPNAYPLSVNAVVSGANQKSNRSPMMQVEPEDAEESLTRLRKFGAVGQIEGGGRVTKYRHYAYDWFGVDKVELAVLAELLLRGAQTVGELRGRAARMEPIADLAALQPVIAQLKQKNLVIPLTPEGRGHVVTHALLLPREIEKLQAQYGSAGASSAPVESFDSPFPASVEMTSPAPVTSPPSPTMSGAVDHEADALREEVRALRDEVETLMSSIDEIREEMRRLKDDLGVH